MNATAMNATAMNAEIRKLIKESVKEEVALSEERRQKKEEQKEQQKKEKDELREKGKETERLHSVFNDHVENRKDPSHFLDMINNYWGNYNFMNDEDDFNYLKENDKQYFEIVEEESIVIKQLCEVFDDIEKKPVKPPRKGRGKLTKFLSEDL